MPTKSEKPDSGTIFVKSAIPKHRQELLKWNGWGYKDSKFIVKDDGIYFTGNRYPIGGLRLPHVEKFARDELGIDVRMPADQGRRPPREEDYPPSNIQKEQLECFESIEVVYSTRIMDRVTHAHGHTLQDMYILKNATFQRIPDVVVWPRCHTDVENLVKMADRENMVIIPFGGGTAVSGAVECPTKETRTIISLDTTQMNKILWLDKENLVACCESGIIGQDLERELQILGFTSGHEPDSYEFSSLGGWVATRASGMKKNTYGNIEDLVVHVKMVTPTGVLQKNCQAPRISAGPDFNHVIMGSEGSLGVVTEVIIKIRPLPKCRRYGSVLFPDFESGVNCMREVAKQRCQPSSIRLMDNDQFKFGMILKPETSFGGAFLDGIKKLYITKFKGYDPDRMCLMTLLFEGDEKDVTANEKKVYGVAVTFDGYAAGQTNGERGYMLTFVIAYIRDLAMEHKVVAESFETSVPWDRALTLVNNVKQVVKNEVKREGITHYLFNCRVTQTYDAGCVIYFYLGFNYGNCNIIDPVDVHHKIEEKARDEIVACGGSISHHHGVGKLRKKWYPDTVSNLGVNLFLAAKKELDPNNIFATNNLVDNMVKCKL